MGDIQKQRDKKKTGVSVVIPAMNEAQNLHYVLPFIPSMVNEVVLVDGNSTDGTVDVARELFPSIKIVHQTGKGKGDALRAGFLACSNEIIVMLDADGSTDPTEIPRFVHALLEGFDYVKGSRFLQGGGSHDLTFWRRLGNQMLCRFVNLLFHTNSSDLCYGYNGFWRHCLDCVDINCDGFEVETLICLRMCKAKLKIGEVPSIENRRIYGSSNLSVVRDGLRVLRTILQERFAPPALPQPGHLVPMSSDHEAVSIQEPVLVPEKVVV